VRRELGLIRPDEVIIEIDDRAPAPAIAPTDRPR
jgi:hypothetical protein